MSKDLFLSKYLQPSYLALGVAAMGHFSFHYVTAMYAAIAVVLVTSWQESFDVLIALWLPASIAIGALAIPSGHLGDRWSFRGSIAIMFMGIGVASLAAGFANDNYSMMVALLVMAAFSAIYHPVAIPWIVRLSPNNTGRNLAFNGIFGGLGTAGAGSITALILSYYNWQMAFIIPAVFNLICGVLTIMLIKANRISENGDIANDTQESAQSQESQGDNYKFLMIICLAITLTSLLVGGLIYNVLQNAMPKLFADELTSSLGSLENALHMVGVVYFIGAFVQIVGGILSDKFPVKNIYIIGWTVQAPLLMLIAQFSGFGVMGIIMGIIFANFALQPTENLLLARITPPKYHGLVFGVKFVLVFGAGPLSVMMVSLSENITGNFDFLFNLTGVIALSVLIFLFWLPKKLLA